MKLYIHILTLILGLSIIISCSNKSSDYYYKGFLDQAELAKPGRVDSLQILPGKNRSIIRFKVGPDRRINKIRISYSSSISADVTTTIADITGTDYGNYKDVQVNNLPEATLMVKVVSFDTKGDSSIPVQATSLVYGDRYISSLYNRVLQNITTVNGVRQLNILNESGKPQDPNVFYTMQRTVITYPSTSGTNKTITITPYINALPLPDLATTGVITQYSVFKPVVYALDEFQSVPANFNF